MPNTYNNLHLTMRGETFEISGSFQLDVPLISVLQHWFGALPAPEDQRLIRRLRDALDTSRAALVSAIIAAGGKISTVTLFKEDLMPVSPVLQSLADSTTAAVGAMTSAKTLIDGIGARVQAAVDKALENGATAEQLQPVQAEADALKASADALAQSVAANPDGGTGGGTPPVQL